MFRHSLSILIVAFVALCLGTPSFAAERPNVIVVLADDLGYGDLGCYNGESKIPTPNLDRLAAQGIRLTNAHSPSSVCSPTRYGLLTGRYAWRGRLKQFVTWQWDGPVIEEDRLTLPGMLVKQGYHTACIGKWHLGWDWPTTDGSRMNDTIPLGYFNNDIRTPFGSKIDYSQPIRQGPTKRGFTYYFGDDVPTFPPFCFIENDRTVGTPTEMKPKELFGKEGVMMPGWDLAAVMPRLTEKAVEYIDQRVQQESKQPFFLYLSLTAPHTPIVPAKPFQGKSQAGAYGDFVHQIDATMGQVLAALKRNGLDESTIVIFTSDNGSPGRDGENMSGDLGEVTRLFDHHPNRPWRGMKADVYEGGHRVPLIARWPGQIQPTSTSGELVCLTDLMATFAGVVDFPLPDDAAEDSFDVLPILQGVRPKVPIRSSIVHHSYRGLFAVRDGDWKLVPGNLGSGGFTKPLSVRPEPGGPGGQLFNLAEDPGEKDNLWEQQPEIVQRLRDHLDQIKQDGRTRPVAKKP